MKHIMGKLAVAGVICGTVLLFAGCSPGAEPPDKTPEGTDDKLEELTDGLVIGEVSEARMEWQGISRRYSYYIPSTFNGKRMPIMIALHGSGGNAEIQMEAGNYAKIAEREGFIVVAPNAVVVLPMGDERATYRNFSAEGLTMFDIADVYGDMALHYDRPAASRTDPATQAGIDDAGFYQELINFYYENGLADKNRAFVSGHSHGGFMALRLAYEHPDIFAGAAAVCGLVLGELRELPAPAEQTKLVFVHSANDTTVPSTGMIYDPSTAPPDGVWAMSLDEGIAFFMEQYGFGELTETGRTQLDTISDMDTTRVTRIEYNDGAAIKYWFTGKDYVTGGVGHAWPGSPSDPTNSSQYQAIDLFWPDLKVELLEEIPTVSIADDQLTVSITRVYDNGIEDTISEMFRIRGNVKKVFEVDDCRVYVSASGTTVNEIHLEM